MLVIIVLIICLLCNFALCRVFVKINFFQIIFQEYHQLSNSLDHDQIRRFVGPDIGPNRFQTLSVDETCEWTNNSQCKHIEQKMIKRPQSDTKIYTFIQVSLKL